MSRECGEQNAPRQRDDRRRGAILGLIMVIVIMVALLGTGLLGMGTANAVAASRALNSAKAFWLAEAGVQRYDRRVYAGTRDSIADSPLGDGTYRVETHLDADPPYADCFGDVAGEEQHIRIGLNFLAIPYERAVYAGNESGEEWIFELRGTGSPAPSGGRERGGRDEVHGDIYVDGDVSLYEQSRVLPAPAPNTYGIPGDVEATGDITVAPTASVSGGRYPHVLPKPPPNLAAMDYAHNHTVNVAAEFARYGITSGYLPVGHPLRDVVVKNPSSRSSECASTAGDDYFFEPRVVSGYGGGKKEARTPLNLGEDQIYYVEGHVWVHHYATYGFRISGQATIAATRDIHLSDNLAYASDADLLGLVAVGERDLFGTLNFGNVYFGDPEFGTLYTVDAFMFAANDFLYNTEANTGRPGEPDTGFRVFGNYAALDKVTVYRDWYTRTGRARPAIWDVATGQWKDALDGVVLTATQRSTLRHYQMIVRYDERIRNQETQPPGLPKSGEGSIYGGISNWDSLSLN